MRPRMLADPKSAGCRAFTRENMPVLALEEATALLELIDLTTPARDGETGIGVDGKIVVGTRENLDAALEALNGVMLSQDGESVAA